MDREEEIAATGADFERLGEGSFRVRMAALFEAACGEDSTGRSGRAVPLYRPALAAALALANYAREIVER
ncbi:MAG: tetratricopeptide repeat protein [Caulobacteraceae bacterium]